MTGQDLDEKIINYNPYLKTAMSYMIAIAVFLGIGFTCLGMFLMGSLDEADLLAAVVVVGIIFVVLAFFGGKSLISGVRGKKSINKYVSEHGQDEVMSSIHKALFVYSQGKKPVTIFTDKFILDCGGGIYDIEDVDWAYGYHKGTDTCILVYLTNGKKHKICNQIVTRSPEIGKCLEAISIANPNAILGYSLKNSDEHKRRVKARKA